jgi:magnesium transporter
VIADVGVYQDGGRVPCGHDLAAALKHWGDHDACFIWIGFVEPSAAELQPVVDTLGIHPLAAEDAVHGQQRPKLERYGDEVLVVSKTVHYVDSHEVIETGDLLIFLGCRYVVTVRHGGGIDIGARRKILEADPKALKDGPAEVLHGLLDLVVDEYSSALTGLEEDVDDVQERVFSHAGQEHSQRIFLLKREVLTFRQAVVPLREPLAELATRDYPAVPEPLRPYFRDVEDHLLRVTDRLSGVDVVLSSALDANIAQVGIRQNEDMRKMSAWLAIGAVPTVVGAIYGMNFQHMPELGWKYGYLLAIGVMALICYALYRNFKHRGWL